MAVAKFEDLNNELEQIINDLHGSNLDIDQAIKKYERGIDLIGELEKKLKLAENKIQKLSPKKLRTKS